MRQDDPDRAADIIVDLVKNHIPRRFQLDPFDEIQVLSPMHKAPWARRTSTCGSSSAQSRREALQRGERFYRLGDKVMQMQNNYDKNVFNGDVGNILSINREDDEIIIVFDGMPVTYSTSDLGDISLAYAATVHKSQGSEYPIVVMPIHNTNHIMLERHLVYTGSPGPRNCWWWLARRQPCSTQCSMK